MAEETKVIAYDRPSGDNSALLASLMANGGANGWMNNPFAYMMFMSLFNGGAWGNGFGGRGAGAALAGADTAMSATSLAQINSLSDRINALGGQIQDNHNSDQLNSNIGKVQAQLGDMGVANVGAFANIAQDINGVKSAIQTTGCGIKSAVEAQGYQNQLANCQQTNTILQQSQGLQNTVTNGFTQLGYLLQQNACDIKTTSANNTQKIVDTLNNHWTIEQQNEINQLKAEVGRKDLLAAIAALGTNGAAAAKVAATAA